ncbi:MAG: chemotaxis protein CheD [Bacteroidales bacterium]|nr:chemotaxis protein CheD [Bacteroidales bacterium]
MEIHTILGSCVAVCLYDTVKNTGGMNHFMLPFWNGRGLASPKYGNIALQRLIEQMLSLGTKKTNLVAKVFGGGNVLESMGPNQNMGQRNISVAFQMLEEYAIPVAANSIGGELGRKIIFETHSGKVRQRYINRLKMREMPVPEMRKK